MPALKSLNRLAVAACGLAFMAQPVLAASTCAGANDLAAFRTAAVQQQLMVAALTCHDVDAYNRFVLAYQPELQKSDADLKAYFVRRGSEADYDTFKTKLANLSSLSDIANGPAYCANAGAAFDMALRSHQALSSFVADQRLMIAVPEADACRAKPNLTARPSCRRPPPSPRRPNSPWSKLRPPAPCRKPPIFRKMANVPWPVCRPTTMPASPYGNPPPPYRGCNRRRGTRTATRPAAAGDRRRRRTPGYYDAAEIPPPPPQRAQLQQAARQQDQQDYQGYYASQYAYPVRRPNRYRQAPPPRRRTIAIIIITER